MAKFNITLHQRPKKDGTCALIFSFTHKKFRKQLNLGIDLQPKQWDDNLKKVKGHPNARILNQKVQYCSAVVEGVLLHFIGDSYGGEEIFNAIEDALFPEKAEEKAKKEADAKKLLSVGRQCADLKKPSTRLTYERTLKHLESFLSEGNTDMFDEINKAWLVKFDNYLAKSNPSANARAIHMRNLRSIINYAIDEEITTNYPFRRFKIKTVKTDKRSLSVETLRSILTYEIEEWQELYRDMFALSFMLMGINFADLLKLEPSSFREGRIVFNRSKTARLYSMYVEPEAMRLIEKYSGTEHLLNIMDSRSDYLQFVRQTNNALRKIGDCERKGLGGKKTHHAICPELSTYWARHTWATVAASLDIPKETIAAALGHGGNTVTDIYIDFDRRKVDEANRKVLDWVLYGKKDGRTETKSVKTPYGVTPAKKRECAA